MTQGHNPTILVIDNDDVIAEGIMLRLRKLGYNCIVVSNGEEGIIAFQFRRIDLVITDINMPRIDGIGVVQRIRSTSDVPIIIITGYQREYLKDLDNLDRVVVLQKPFRPTVIIELVETELAMSSPRGAKQEPELNRPG